MKKIIFRLWTGMEIGPSSNFLEEAHRLKLIKAKGYREDNQSLSIELPYSDEEIQPFEEYLAKAGFKKVVDSIGGQLKGLHYVKSSF